MTKIVHQGPFSGIAKCPSLILLFSSTEIGLLKGTKNWRETGHPAKEARHMYNTTFRTILSSPPIRPMVESTQKLARNQLNTLRRQERRSVPKCLQV